MPSAHHPRNRHQGYYDLDALTRAVPELAPRVYRNPTGEPTIDFSDPGSVRLLNRALLQQQYGICNWTLPAGYLCPPVPGRADYVHHLADLLAGSGPSALPRGRETRVIDIGVGANCIYPLIGVAEYGWSFVGSDIDPSALRSAKRIIAGQSDLSERIELRLQPDPASIFRGVVRPGESFAASMCNPPFHPSAAAAEAAAERKLRNLAGGKRVPLRRNFGGQSNELWCRGGEVGFLRQMIVESATLPRLCSWFTALVSQRNSLPPLERLLQSVDVRETRLIDMALGQKKTRILAWRFN